MPLSTDYHDTPRCIVCGCHLDEEGDCPNGCAEEVESAGYHIIEEVDG